MATLFSDYLGALGVRHTEDYSDKRFYTMPFQSMFGLVKLLQEYGVEAQGLRATDKSVFAKLPTPFLADTDQGFMIVTGIHGDTVDYLSQSKALSAPVTELTEAWNGVALVATASRTSCEPEYAKHHLDEIFGVVKTWALGILCVGLFVGLFAASGLWHSWSAILIAAIDLVGIYVSFMLVQKSLNIKNARADAVCSVMEAGGCDTIAKSEASSFLGIVKWSEVGLAYFSVSFLALVFFPEKTAPWLALCNAACLPYTVWSITYQKFVARTWCTLCVTVQTCLWALFICYLAGGWWHGVWPLEVPLFALIASYGIALLGINRFDNALSKLLHPNNNLINRDNDGYADQISR